ncbi:rhomboid family intramembrane serine protease [Paracrocinitomix mangrovi]|uniref:rhomboid family intramembrane serine protease n=1 Tax=Paracrocinitomix mangrovi TaxID=2862509 RepID=UPI001C8EC2D1|nr:rhomboid family intramembrane serine protease [Paracrocinitomix mangrovi]UKN01943.1 rhomboid family intramembrane serine protease [Paracrocinitomix mangrovi]
MFGSIFRNMPQVTKNLLIINVLLFLAKIVLVNQAINLDEYLAMHYPTSPFFYPHQIVTSVFMHGDFTHLLFNMFGVVFVGSHLERIWGSKRYLIFYMFSAIGGVICATGIHAIEMYQAAGSLVPDITLSAEHFLDGQGDWMVSYNYANLGGYEAEQLKSIINISLGQSLGASGALYGVLMAFAMLFPNTEFMLIFPPIPIKAKWLALILGGFAVYSGVTGTAEGIGHFGHLGGMLFGFILIKIWQKDKTKFY